MALVVFIQCLTAVLAFKLLLTKVIFFGVLREYFTKPLIPLGITPRVEKKMQDGKWPT